MILTFTEVNRVMRKLELVQSFCCEMAWESPNFCNVWVCKGDESSHESMANLITWAIAFLVEEIYKWTYENCGFAGDTKKTCNGDDMDMFQVPVPNYLWTWGMFWAMIT